MPTSSAAVRIHEPKQDRSRVRVQRLLDAADRLLARDGYEAMTIARLTNAAGVPVGTFYQFFEDKDAIVEVLAQRYVALGAELIDDLVATIIEIPPGSRLGAAFEAFVELYATNPAYRAIRAGSYTSPALRTADNANVEAAIDGVRRILITGTKIPDGPRVRSTSRTLQLVVDTLLYRAGELRPNEVRPFVAEAKEMLTILERDAIKRLRRKVVR